MIKKNDKIKGWMNAVIERIIYIISNTNWITLVSGLFLMNTIVYNFFYSGQKWLSDLWYVNMYLCIAVFLFQYSSRNNVILAAFITAIVRFWYNVGIMFSWWRYDLTESNYGVIGFVVLILILTERKWLKQRR